VTKKRSKWQRVQCSSCGGREQMQQREAKLIRSPRRREAGTTLGLLGRAPWQSCTRRRRYHRTADFYQPTGWSSPGAKKAVRIYWRVMITSIKMLLAIPLSIMAIGAFWLLWIIITL
jgi:hypothetical protein